MYTATAAHDVNDVDALTKTITEGISYILQTRGKTYLKCMYAQINRKVVQGDNNRVYTAFLYWSQIYLSL